MIGYMDAGYLSGPHYDQFQTWFCILTWRFMKSSKQTLMTTSTNHSEIIALYEATHECVWLHRMINHIQQSCGIGQLSIKIIGLCYIDANRLHKEYVTKNITPRLFYPP